jgi:hypothetical protein
MGGVGTLVFAMDFFSLLIKACPIFKDRKRVERVNWRRKKPDKSKYC